MAQFGLPELLIVLVIVIVLFGVGRISKIAGEVGSGIKAFREGMQPDEEDTVDSNTEKEQTTEDAEKS